MPLFISDFSRIAFANVSGPVLPRRQKVVIENMIGEDLGDYLSLRLQPEGWGLWFNTMADLAAARGTLHRQLGLLRGYRTNDDGGEGLFFWDSSATDPANGGTIVGSSSAGRWKRIHDSSVVHVDWFGAPHDSATDALPMFTAALNLVPVGGTLRLGPYTYVIHNKWDLQDGKNIEGCTGDVGGLFGGTVIRYLGPEDLSELGCAINARQFAFLRDFKLQIGAGRKTRAGICIGTDQYRMITFDNIGVQCWADDESYFENAYTIGSTVAIGGCDTLKWIRGIIDGPANAAFLVQGSQPYDLVSTDQTFNNSVAGNLGNPGGAVSHGTILKTTGTYFGSFRIENPNIQYFAELIDSPLDGMTNVSVLGGQWEGMKRIWTGTGVNANAACVVSIEGGRYNTTQLDKPVYRADGTTIHIAAEDRRLIVTQQGSPLTLRAMCIGAGLSSAVDNTATIDIDECTTFTAEGCIFPRRQIVNRINRTDEQSHGTYIRGCKAYTAPNALGVILAPIAERHGPENADFYWTADGTALDGTATPTVATVSLPQVELGSGGSFASGGLTDYHVYMHPHEYTGTPPSGAFATRLVRNQVRKDSFQVELGDEVGAGNTIKFSVRLQLRSDIP